MLCVHRLDSPQLDVYGVTSGFLFPPRRGAIGVVPKPTPPPEELLGLIATAYAYLLSADLSAETLGRSTNKSAIPIIQSSSMDIEANVP